MNYVLCDYGDPVALTRCGEVGLSEHGWRCAAHGRTSIHVSADKMDGAPDNMEGTTPRPATVETDALREAVAEAVRDRLEAVAGILLKHSTALAMAAAALAIARPAIEDNIVAWLRSTAPNVIPGTSRDLPDAGIQAGRDLALADAIERGDHHVAAIRAQAGEVT